MEKAEALIWGRPPLDVPAFWSVFTSERISARPRESPARSPERAGSVRQPPSIGPLTVFAVPQGSEKANGRERGSRARGAPTRHTLESERSSRWREPAQ